MNPMAGIPDHRNLKSSGIMDSASVSNDMITESYKTGTGVIPEW
jgi:hypothetical protein